MSVAIVRFKVSFAQGRLTIAALDRHEYLPPMAARRGRLQFRRLASCRFGLVEFSLGEKNTGQADSSLVGEGVEFNRLSGQLLSLFKLAKINHHSRQEITGRRIPRRELLRAPEFGQTFGKFPFDKKANPTQRRVRFRQIRIDRDGFLGITACGLPSLLLLLAT